MNLHVSSTHYVAACLAVILLGFADFAWAKKEKGNECEVCLKFMTKFIDGLPAQARELEADIKTNFMDACKVAQGKEERFCYRVGGSEISATSIVDSLMSSIKSFVPPDKICERIKQKIPDIGDLKYDKPIDLSNLAKLKVRELKKVLADWGKTNECKGCLEKHEYIEAVKRLMPIHAPEFVKPKEDL